MQGTRDNVEKKLTETRKRNLRFKQMFTSRIDVKIGI